MNDVLTILKKVGAVLTKDHFVYTSGKHGSVYVNKDALYPLVRHVSQIGKLFALKYRHKNIDVVVGPALGGIILSQWTSYHLSRMVKRPVLGLYTEKTVDKNQIFTRGYEVFVKRKRVLIVEDITTTGGSVKKVIDTVRSAGGKIIGVCAMINRDPRLVNTKTIGVPFTSLGILKAEAYGERACPLCKKGIPINTTIGHGGKYLASKG